MSDTRWTADDRAMRVMAWLDGALDADEAAQVEATVRSDEALTQLADDLRAQRTAMRAVLLDRRPGTLPAGLDGLAERVLEQANPSWAEADALLVMQWADGELASAQQARVDTLVATYPALAAFAEAIGETKQALRARTLAADAATALPARLDGLGERVVAQAQPTRTEAQPAAADGPRQAAQPRAGGGEGPFDALVAWVGTLGWPRLAAGSGFAVALALLINVAGDPARDGVVQPAPVGPDRGARIIADGADGGALEHLRTAPEPSPVAVATEELVIIEEMELDGGTVMIEGGEAGNATIIWHMPAATDKETTG